MKIKFCILMMLMGLFSCVDSTESITLHEKEATSSNENELLSIENQMSSEIIDFFNNFENRVLLVDYELSKNELKSLVDAGFEGHSVKVYQRIDHESGEIFKDFEIDGDAFISKEELLLLAKKGIEKQFRSNNLVNNNQTIPIMGINLNNNPNVRAGLVRAVNNYNALDMGLQFTLSFETIFSYRDIWKWYSPGIKVRMDHLSTVGGNAGFPYSNGTPYKYVRIGIEMEDFPLDVIEHVVTHEIGHCIGMRHTDYFNRSLSCGGLADDEGDGGVGAIHIPGTPEETAIDLLSIFKSCFNGLENGEFTNVDVTALESIYPE